MDDGTSSVTFPESADSSPYILAHVGSYVPAGYIMLDHSPINESSPYSKSVSSIWPKPPPRVIQSWNYLFWKTLRSAFFVQRSPRLGSNLFVWHSEKKVLCLQFVYASHIWNAATWHIVWAFEAILRWYQIWQTPKLSLKPRQSGFRLETLFKIPHHQECPVRFMCDQCKTFQCQLFLGITLSVIVFTSVASWCQTSFSRVRKVIFMYLIPMILKYT